MQNEHSGNSPRIGAQLYSVRQVADTDPMHAFERLRAVGYDAVELYGFVDRVDILREAIAHTGVTAVTGHVTLQHGNLAEISEAAHALGLTDVVDPHSEEWQWSNRDDLARLADKFSAIAHTLAKEGLEVGYHNHAFEASSRIDGLSSLEFFAEAVDPAVFLEIDTYWAAAGGLDAVDVLTRLGSRVRYLHLKDGPIATGPHDQLALGEGRMPIPSIVEAATEVRFAFVEVDSCDGDPFDVLARGRAYLDTLAVRS